MKKNFLLFLLTLLPTAATAGWEHGNAGDSYAAEFVMTAKDLLLRLKMVPSPELKEVDLDRLAGVIQNTTVRTEETVIFEDQREVEAINYPDKKLIVLSRSMWRSRRLESETLHRYTFVLHEYLGIMRVDDTQYRISGPLVALLDLKNYNPSRWWNPLNPMNYVTLNLIYSSGSCQLEGVAFDLNKTEEIQVAETKGNCGDEYRKVVIAKSSGTAPPSTQARGTFHRYQVGILDNKGTTLGQFTYEPEWGRCLGPQEGACSASGKILEGGVEFVFLLRPF